MSLRRLLTLLLLVLAPIPIAAAEPAYRAVVFWAGSGVILLAVAGGLASVLQFPGGRGAAVSGQPVAWEPRDGAGSAGRALARTNMGQ